MKSACVGVLSIIYVSKFVFYFLVTKAFPVPGCW